MSDVMTDTEQVKAVVQGVSAWMPVISTLTGGVLAGGVALLVSRMNHRYAREREAMAAAERQRHEIMLAEDKKEKELYFISTQLVFRLERFAQECAEVVNDDGWEDDKGYTRTSVSAEAFATEDIDGDWRVLPGRLLYRIRELSVLIPEANRYISVVNDNDNPPDWQMTFKERRYQYSRLGMRALLLARRLRQLNVMPSSHLDNDSPWSVQNVLWAEWRKQRKSRSKMAREVPDYDL
ncbi:hypothetical protein [Escherichia coli]|uniref:hypothetical protein n=1 Tax=Escherichia coli TaxID=562 RepID=UPI000B7D2DCA|nr:hypothetical protein [Escherichia coli]